MLDALFAIFLSSLLILAIVLLWVVIIALVLSFRGYRVRKRGP